MRPHGRISVCIATHRRPRRLAELLGDLARQLRRPDEVIVVDNDPAQSAAAVVAEYSLIGAPFPIRYAVQPRQNISLTRNRTVALAAGQWLAFVDDDERAPPAWLGQLEQARIRHSADGVLGPVMPAVPREAPAWIRRGYFYDWARMASGSVVPRNQLRFGNVLLRASLLRTAGGPFDAAYGLTGGEDGDLLARLAQGGARIVWCDEALVREPVEAARLSLRWLLLRALRGGQDFARHSLAGRYGPVTAASRLRLFTRAAVQLLVATALSPLSMPFGLHRAAHWLTKAAANLGKLTVLGGWHYREYAGKTS